MIVEPKNDVKLLQNLLKPAQDVVLNNPPKLHLQSISNTDKNKALKTLNINRSRL